VQHFLSPGHSNCSVVCMNFKFASNARIEIVGGHQDGACSSVPNLEPSSDQD